ncbi:hypothetical protein FA95DRAFT_408047 [Auriscalpium vulgare]|uniref:Uncharacterized protein n=1 Tax=Auriscalpium vulgare TaxID=40419 RepID=A0ACB8RI20_9AGAM|nr:hypothetical protein FA95DRAFT_408047 [Auriscalpium vulgare]
MARTGWLYAIGHLIGGIFFKTPVHMYVPPFSPKKRLPMSFRYQIWQNVTVASSLRCRTAYPGAPLTWRLAPLSLLRRSGLHVTGWNSSLLVIVMLLSASVLPKRFSALHIFGDAGCLLLWRTAASLIVRPLPLPRGSPVRGASRPPPKAVHSAASRSQGLNNEAVYH